MITIMCVFVCVCMCVCLGRSFRCAADRRCCRLVCEPSDRRDDTDGNTERFRTVNMYEVLHTHTHTHTL